MDLTSDRQGQIESSYQAMGSEKKGRGRPKKESSANPFAGMPQMAGMEEAFDELSKKGKKGGGGAPVQLNASEKKTLNSMLGIDRIMPPALGGAPPDPVEAKREAHAKAAEKEAIDAGRLQRIYNSYYEHPLLKADLPPRRHPTTATAYRAALAEVRQHLNAKNAKVMAKKAIPAVICQLARVIVEWNLLPLLQIELNMSGAEVEDKMKRCLAGPLLREEMAELECEFQSYFEASLPMRLAAKMIVFFKALGAGDLVAQTQADIPVPSHLADGV